MLFGMRSLILTIFLGSVFVARGDVQQVGPFSSRDVGRDKVDAFSRLLSPNDDVNSFPFIISGTDVTDVGKYPFFVRLSINKGDRVGNCGGVLIAPDIVLSAAHCNSLAWDDPDPDPDFDPDAREVTAIQGSLTRTGGTSSKCAQWINDPEYINHPDQAFYSDYALCKLETPIIFDDSSVSLQLNDDPSVPADGDMLWAIGFGRTSNAEGSASSTLKEVEVPAMSNDACENLSNNSPRTERHICAGYGVGGEIFVDEPWPSTCKGDSGGPLLRRNDVNGKVVYTHVGVNSFTSGGCGSKSPDGYARTSSRIDWIRTTACNDLNSVSSFCDNFLNPSPTARPTASPTARPTASPAARPTASPTARPTARPTASPTARPTASPTSSPNKKNNKKTKLDKKAKKKKSERRM